MGLQYKLRYHRTRITAAVFFLCFLICGLLGVPSNHFSQQPESFDGSPAAPATPINEFNNQFIITLKDGASTQSASVSAADSINNPSLGTAPAGENPIAALPTQDITFLNSLGATPLSGLGGRTYLVKLAATDAESAADQAATIAGNKDVALIEPNYPVQLNLTPNDPRFNEQWDFNRNGPSNYHIDAEEGWDLAGDTEVVVAVIDSGIDYKHADLKNNLWKNPGETPDNGQDDDNNGVVDDLYGFNPIDVVGGFDVPSNQIQKPGDPRDKFNGHGTHVSGTIAASTNNSIGVSGIGGHKGKIRPMAIRVFTNTGYGSLASILSGIDYVIKMKQLGVNIRVMNMSLGFIEGTPEPVSLREAMFAAEQNGIMSVVAAGNGGYDGVSDNNDNIPVYPACYSGIQSMLAVAAIGKDGKLGVSPGRSHSFSNYGERTVQVAAPGVSILSTIGEYSGAYQSWYASYNGTSMATPHVAGIAAMIASKSPGMSPVQIALHIRATVKPDAELNRLIASPGVVSLKNALAALQPVTRYTVSGKLTLYGNGEPGVTVTAAGYGSAVTDAGGNFSIPNIPSGSSITLVPSKGNYAFNPSSRSLTVNSNTSGQNFVVEQRAIDGRILIAGSGSPLGNVTVSVPPFDTTTTSGAGYFTLRVPHGAQNLVVTPSKSGYTFSPQNRSYSLITSNQVNQNFTASSTSSSYSVSGQVTLYGRGEPGVTINAGSYGNALTDSNGNFTIQNIQSGSNVTITPSKGGYVFGPYSRLVTVNSNVSGVNFIIEQRAIDGRITTSAGAPIGNVDVIVPPFDATTTNSNGNYTLRVPHGAQSVVVAAHKNGYTFNPPTRSYAVITQNVVNQDFVGTGGAGGSSSNTISGQVTLYGVGESGVTVNAGSYGNVVTSSNGNFTIQNVPNGTSVTLTPSKGEYIFNPPYRTITVNGNMSGVNFVVEQRAIDGRVTNVYGQPIGNVTLSVPPFDTTTTNGQGYFTLRVPHNSRNLTVTPSKSGMTFSPTSRFYPLINQNITSAYFVGQ